MKISHFLAVTAAAACFANVARAEDPNGERWPRWYVGLSGGVSFLEDSDIEGVSTGEAEFDTGGMATVSLGYRPAFGAPILDGLRFEVELGYHSNSLDGATISGVPVGTSDSLTAWTLMANAYYDFRNASRWTPYVGAGIGWADVELGNNSGLGNVNDDDKTLAYQVMTGVAYSPASIPLTEWSLGYRYFALSEAEFSTGAGTVRLDDIASHNVEAGARFRF